MLPLLPFNSYKLLRPAGSYELQVGLLMTAYRKVTYAIAKANG